MHGALFCIINAPSWKKKIYAIIIYTYITYTYSYGTSMNLMTFLFFYLLTYDIWEFKWNKMSKFIVKALYVTIEKNI